MDGHNHNHTRNQSPHPRSTPGPKPDGGSYTMPRQNSANSTSSSGSIGGYNAMTRTTNNMVRSHTVGGGIGGGIGGGGSGGGGVNAMNNHNHQSPRSGSQGDRYENTPYATPTPTSRHTPVQRPTTPGAHYAHHQQQQQQHQQQHQQHQQQHQQQQHYLNDPPPYQPPPPVNKPLQQQQQYHSQQHHQQQQHHPQQQQQQQQQQRDDYSPGNVRSLVHNYQISMNNSVSNNTITASNGPGSGPSPTAPPRRSRPMSAGPLRSSSNSAFSVPPRHSEPEPRGTGGAAGAGGSGRTLPKPPPALTTPRTLPRTPDAGDKMAPGKLSAPPPLRPQSQGPNGDGTPRKNATWYEYGCV
jgi:hypothetical protein